MRLLCVVLVDDVPDMSTRNAVRCRGGSISHTTSWAHHGSRSQMHPIRTSCRPCRRHQTGKHSARAVHEDICNTRNTHTGDTPTLLTTSGRSGLQTPSARAPASLHGLFPEDAQRRQAQFRSSTSDAGRHRRNRPAWTAKDRGWCATWPGGFGRQFICPRGATQQALCLTQPLRASPRTASFMAQRKCHHPERRSVEDVCGRSRC